MSSPSPATRTAAAPSPTDVATELHLVVGRIARALRQAHTVGDITLSEASALARLERGGPAAPGQLAEEERVRPQAMAGTVATLEEKGYVVRRSDPGDGRRVILSLTDAGAAVRRDRRSESTRLLEEALVTALTPAELRRLAAALPLLGRLAEHL
jgi:DNA-binding MarR family transcriptional regulator